MASLCLPVRSQACASISIFFFNFSLLEKETTQIRWRRNEGTSAERKEHNRESIIFTCMCMCDFRWLRCYWCFILPITTTVVVAAAAAPFSFQLVVVRSSAIWVFSLLFLFALSLIVCYFFTNFLFCWDFPWATKLNQISQKQ